MPTIIEVNGGKGRIEVHAQADAERAPEIIIYGDIGDAWWADGATSAAQVVAELNAIDAPEISLRINSAGGVVSDALAIYNALKRHPARVVGIIDGVAYSSASLIVMAADELRMAENALLMIHAPWGISMGNATKLRENADTLDKYSQAMANSYVRPGGLSYDQALALLTDGEDHYYTAAEAQTAGLIDAVEPAAMPIAAKVRGLDLTRFFNPAQAAKTPTEHAMPDSNTPAAGAPDPAKPAANTDGANTPPPAAADSTADNVVALQEAAQAQERKRIAARNAELAPVFSRFEHEPEIQALYREVLADPSVSADQARAKLLDKLGEGAEPLANVPDIRSGADARDKVRAGMRDALLMRVGAQAHDGGNEFRGLKLHEMARACLRAINYPGADRLAPEELAPLALTWGPVRGAQTTSDFPVLLEEVLHKLILRGFNAIPTAYERFCKIGDVSDYRNWNRLVPGLIGNLDGVNEHGEYRDKHHRPSRVRAPRSQPDAVRRRGAVPFLARQLGQLRRSAERDHLRRRAHGHGQADGTRRRRRAARYPPGYRRGAHRPRRRHARD